MRKQKRSIYCPAFGLSRSLELEPETVRQEDFVRNGSEANAGWRGAIHYTTATEKQLAEDGLGINSGVVIPLGVNQELLGGSAENFGGLFPKLANSPYVLLLSRLHPKKNIESLLEVFSAVTKEGEQKRWKLVIAGNGERDYIEKLKRLAFEKCGDNVIFAGWLDGARKAAAIRGAELVVLPSFQENFGLSVVEALACGVPV